MAERWKVYQTPKSSSWIIDFHYRDEHGVSRRYRRSAGRGVNKRDAERKARALYREKERDPLAFVEKFVAQRREAVDAQPFSRVADDYYGGHVLVRLKKTTQRTHEQILRVHLKPHFGTTDIRSIDRGAVDSYLGAKCSGRGARRPLSKKSANNHLSVLSSLFTYAVDRGWASENPAHGRRLKTENTGFQWLNTESAEEFLSAVLATDPAYYPIFLAALRTGMRQGELLALRWHDVQLDSTPPRIVVRRSLSHGHLSSTKGNRVRVVPVQTELAEVLRPLMGDPEGLVFGAPCGDALTGNMLKNPMRRAKKAIGRPELRFHDLRHSFASQLTAKGTPLQVVQKLLGHSDIKTTAKYSHLEDGLFVDAIERLGV